MSCNIGMVDRIIRIVLGLIILAAGWMMESLWGLVGLIPLGTALIKFCPLYPIFGIDTGCKTKASE